VATISKFYLLDAATPNTGTMPTSEPGSTFTTMTGGAAGSTTARDATDVHGSSNPDIESTFTSNANTLQQDWGCRRFVTRPLAARTFAGADGNWTFSAATSESSLNHNQSITVVVYGWRPSTGLQVGTTQMTTSLPEPTSASTETANSNTAAWGSSLTILDGDILVFDIWDSFVQSMGTAYTSNFAYNGTTEASTTTCASFISPPAAITLYTPNPARPVPTHLPFIKR